MSDNDDSAVNHGWLNSIDSPDDLKKLNLRQLQELAHEIRTRLISVTAKNGGHLGPNLGVVELTLALHYVFDSPRDRLIFDVGHQAYVHKLLTGRRELFHTIRQPGGLSGFMSRSESIHDCYGAGHAGTALSAALGMAVARDLDHGNENIVVVAGDAAFTNGISFEALNNIASSTKRFIVVLNDNKWSIDKNIGSIAAHFEKIAPSSMYSGSSAHSIRPANGNGRKDQGRTADACKTGAAAAGIFGEFGLTYRGPIDGHNIETLIKALEDARSLQSPVLLHVLTDKGRGFEPARLKQKKFHGLGPYDPTTGETKQPVRKTYSEVFGETMVRLAHMNTKVVTVTAAMPNGTGLDLFRPHFPRHYFDVGIAEEHAVIFAAGMATRGYKPFCAIYSTFLQRAFDPVIHDVCLQNLPVVFCMDRGGLSGDDGPTHHGVFDIAYLRGIPNIVHMDPKDEKEFADMLYTAMLHDGPAAIRYPRGSGSGSQPREQLKAVPIGTAEVIRDGEQVVIFSLGTILPVAAEAAALLEAQGFSTALINMRFAKPLDTRTIQEHAGHASLLISFEDHVLNGGFGSALLEELNKLGVQVPLVRLGWPDQFIEQGNPDALRIKYGITAQAAIAQARPYLDMARPEKAAGKR